ncbi:MAG: pyridoxal phosphate-dependent aminotransferase [Nitrospira sp.]|nr:pyridoxal phosphate-dependent aminotransferase [Nitrospira sp.]
MTANHIGGNKRMQRVVSRRMADLAQSEIRAMTQACASVKGINMAQGVCDTPAPSIVLEAAQRAIKDGRNVYTRFDGLVELRQALAQKLVRYNGIQADPDIEIVVSAGATGAFHCACEALLEPGDEVIVFEPFYQYHLSALLAVEAVPVTVRMEPPDWTFTLTQLEDAVTAKTKAVVVNSPGNPSGKVWTRDELDTVAAIAKKYDLFVFSDEIYEYFLYDGRSHLSMATLPGMAERTITVGGYSKTFSVTGWRIGYTVAARPWAQAIGAVNDLLYVCAPAPLQMGIAAGVIELPGDFYKELARSYQQKRDRFCEALAEAGLTPSIPEGAYYVLADVSKVSGPTGKARAMALLEATGVAGVPGEAFFSGPEGARFVRFSYAKTDEELDEACRRLKRAKF